MRPIELTLSAFGPYAGTTTLSFDALGTQRLFVITGPTGSGKTTIFEAILYALYGKLSKRGMDPASLRCDFLKPSDDTVTFVDFTFDIGGKTYKIHRQPKQRVAKKRGEGTREIGQEAVLECVGHEAFLPLSRISDVDKKITELIGLDDEQFQKIVMLPQGAFQEFLISTTKDKIELLRHIFDTSLYDLALTSLKSRVADVTGAYNDLKAAYRSQATMLRFEEPLTIGDQPSERALQTMEQLAQADEGAISALQQNVADESARYQAAVQRLNQEKQHNDDVEKWQQAGQALQALQAEKPTMDALAARLAAADRARGIVDKEARVQESAAATQAQTHTLQQAVEAQAAATQKRTLAEAAYEKAEQEKAAADQAYNEWPALTKKLEKMKDYVRARADLAEAKKNAKHVQQTLAALEKTLAATAQELADLDQKVQEKTRLQNEVHRLQLDREKLGRQLENERRQYALAKKVLDAQRERAKLERDAQDAEQVFQQAEQRLQEARAQNRRQLAATLANELSDGEPCPVCGALHHPNPAAASNHQDEEEHCLAQRDEAQKKHLAVQAALVQQDKNQAEFWNELQAEVPALTAMDEVAAFAQTLKERGVDHKSQFQALQAQLTTLDESLRRLNDSEAQRETKKAAHDQQKDEHTRLIASQSHWQTLCDSHQHSVEDMEQTHGFSADVNPKALEAQVAQIEQAHQEAAAQLERAARAQQNAQMAQVQADEVVHQAQRRLQELTQQHAADLALFEEARNAAFASAEAYVSAKADIAARTALQQQLDRYAEQRTRAETLYDDLSERLKDDRSLHDLSASESQCRAVEQALNEANDRLAAHKSRCDANRKLIEAIRALFDEFQQMEADYALLGKLRDVLDGKNRFNMKLETFAQAYYFEQMLQHANARLARMTHGRYSFRRKETVHDARRQAGLDLAVMDQYTGRARDVSTLSGGESFKASLSLALGLADVVSSESGGVELSTIFIDEGFGTLDEESLDDTVETLMNLQNSGRLVGVISHVAELKERIPAHLVVESGANGSQAHFEVRE